jgi:flagellar biosynthesis/type III secretory pathway chaperone
MLAGSNKEISQNTVINSMTQALKNLIAVIEKENSFLKDGKVSAIRDVAEEKISALQKFNGTQELAEDYVKMGGKFDKNAASITKLQELLLQLNKLNYDNDVLIKANLEVSNTLVEIFKDMKTKETLRSYGYNKDGKVSVAGKIDKVMPSIGLNNKI